MSSIIEPNISLGWDYCPPELLLLIFKNLDLKSLLSCMTVSRRWKDIAVDYIEFHHLWPKIIEEEMVNLGATFEKKSTLEMRDIVINSILWSYISSAFIARHHTYNLRDIKKMYVHKDKLIVKSKENVKYFNISTFDLIKSYKSTSNEKDFIENDYMIAIYKSDSDEIKKELRLYGKTSPTDNSFSKQLMYSIDFILLYRVEGNICYVVTHKFVVWGLMWTWRRWDLKLVGRYYGSPYDAVCALHVFNKRVSMVTKHGLILTEDPETRKFDKVVSRVPHAEGVSNWVLFNKSDIVVSVTNVEKRIRLSYELEFNHMMLECADMTCATEHGDVLFLGFKDGVVAICRPKLMLCNNGKPERYIQVRDFDRTIEEPAVLALEVFEDKLSHHLLIATQHKIIQLLITYPHDVRTYYE